MLTNSLLALAGASSALALSFHGTPNPAMHKRAALGAVGAVGSEADHLKRDFFGKPHSKRMARKVNKGLSRRASTSYSTTANYYATTGGYSACHTYFGDNDMVIALPTGLYPDVAQVSEYCGKTVLATNPATGVNVTLTVQDASWAAEYATLPREAFLALGGSEEAGELAITFAFTDAAVVAPSSTSAAQDVTSSSAARINKAASKSSTPSSSSSSAEEEAVTPSSSSSAVEVKVAQTSAAAAKVAQVQATTTAAPATTTPAYDYASASSASKASADAAWAASSSAEAAAKSKSQADAAWASSSSAAAAAASQSAADAQAAKDAQASKDAQAAASSKAAADAAWASSSSSAAAAEATKASDSGASSGSGNTYKGGFATYYMQNGVAGNCGTVAQESDKVIALPTATYANGAHCGKQIRLTRTDNGASVVATVRDSCPTCVNNESLDLSEGAFLAIATVSEGMVPIEWQFV